MMEFIKRNATSFKDALMREADGLQLLANTLNEAGETGPGALKVPEVLRVSESELVIRQITGRPADDGGMAALGAGLARLHRQQHEDYGLTEDNLIGLSRQFNTRMDDWGRFYLEYRLKPQLAMIADTRIRAEFESVVERHASALRDFLNQNCAHPSLLHGDLWGGNVIFDREGPWMIDPAVYYGDREADIAMTELFGGFLPEFYRAYDSVYPRTAAYSLKRPIYNLYHTLNHYNLFGASYLGPCRRNIMMLERL